jgi:hypothetical protein
MPENASRQPGDGSSDDNAIEADAKRIDASSVLFLPATSTSLPVS